tara:strand:- start:1009 stop:1437 length:429 start_codon:yes stop_codon:yes gene_type:complete
MICTAVPLEATDIVWGDVSAMLNKAIQTSGGKYHIDDIYRHIKEGYYNLWLIIDEKKDEKVIAAITTRLIEYPNRRALAMDWVGGKRMSEWLPIALEKFNSFAKDCGCSHLEGYGRKAWTKVLKNYNWKPEYIAYRMEIDNG